MQVWGCFCLWLQWYYAYSFLHVALFQLPPLGHCLLVLYGEPKYISTDLKKSQICLMKYYFFHQNFFLFFLYTIRSKKNATFSKSVFSYLYLSKYTILYTKLNTIGWTLWCWKLYQKIFYDKYFIRLWKRPLKTTSHKKRLFFKG